MLFGKKVSPAFRAKATIIASELGVKPDDLMLCMAFETGGTFSPSISNGAGSGAVGLIQFMPQTAAVLGTSTKALAKLSAVDQLSFVELYFKRWNGRLHNLGDLYMAILWPAAVGKPDTYVIFNKATRPTAYGQNRGLDYDEDGNITRGECVRKVGALAVQGKQWEA